MKKNPISQGSFLFYRYSLNNLSSGLRTCCAYKKISVQDCAETEQSVLLSVWWWYNGEHDQMKWFRVGDKSYAGKAWIPCFAGLLFWGLAIFLPMGNRKHFETKREAVNKYETYIEYLWNKDGDCQGKIKDNQSKQTFFTKRNRCNCIIYTQLQRIREMAWKLPVIKVQ